MYGPRSVDNSVIKTIRKMCVCKVLEKKLSHVIPIFLKFGNDTSPSQNYGQENNISIRNQLHYI